VSYINDNKADLYNETLEVYNNKFKESAKKLINYNSDDNRQLKESRDLLLSKIKTPLQNYSEIVSKKIDNKILAAVGDDSADTVDEITTCQAQAASQYKYEYE